MVSHRWMLWAGRSATTAIALVAGSLPQLTVWPGQLILCLFFLQIFPSLGSSGWLITSQPAGCSTVSLKMAEKPSARWREKADDRALREGETGALRVSESLPTQWM